MKRVRPPSSLPLDIASAIGSFADTWVALRDGTVKTERLAAARRARALNIALPHELILQILANLLSPETDFHHAHIADIRVGLFPHYAHLRRIARVNSAWGRCANEILHRHVFLESGKRAKAYFDYREGFPAPRVVVLAGRPFTRALITDKGVTTELAGRIVRLCDETTFHIGLHMLAPLELELLYSPKLSGLTSLTVGGIFCGPDTVPRHGVHFTLEHLSVHGFGLPLVLLGALLPAETLIPSALLHALQQKQLVETVPRDALWSIQPEVLGTTPREQLPQAVVPADVAPMELVDYRQSIDVRGNFLPCQSWKHFVDLPVDERTVAILRCFLPTLQTFSYTGWRHTNRLDRNNNGAYGAVVRVDFHAEDDEERRHESAAYTRRMFPEVLSVAFCARVAQSLLGEEHLNIL